MTNHLEKRGTVWYFRRKIPTDLEQHFGRKQMMLSLKTRDYAEAKRLAATHTVITDAQFAAARAGRSSPEPSDTWAALMAKAPFEELYQEELEQQWQRAYEANPEPFDLAARARQEATASADKLLNDSGLPTTSQLDALRVTGGLGFLPDNMPTPEQAARALGRRGVYGVDTAPVSSTPTAATGHVTTLRDVIPSWAKRSGADAEAIKRAEKALSLFEEAVGAIPLRNLKKAHGAQFVGFLLDEDRPFGAKTAHNHASYITALLNVAVKDDLIERNLLDLSIDKSIGAKKREPWTDAEIKQMYEHALFSDRIGDVEEWQGVRPVDGRALLLILQHTGARIGEIAQLRRGDFQTQDGMTAIRITAEAGTVKTAESERSVPLADHLLADPWFSAWLEAIMDGKRTEAPAFASMAGRVRGPADTAVQWFKEFREAAGLPSGRLNGSHKFRHWIRTAMNALDVAAATQDAITGHAAGGSTGTKVYTRVPLSVMRVALNRVAFPKLGE